jgi:hypothetical protein
VVLSDPLKHGAGNCGISADKTPPLTSALTPASPSSSINMSGEAVNLSFLLVSDFKFILF